MRLNSKFYCLKTGRSLREFLDSIDATGEVIPNYRVAVHISPLLRKTDFNLAESMIKAGIEADDATDWQQQMLGHPSESNTNRVTIDALRESMNAPTPSRSATINIAGIDQGRGQYWLWIMSCHFMDADYASKPVEQVLERTIRRVIFGGAVVQSEIPDLLKKYSCEYGLIDNEPERTRASELQRSTCLEMADQRGNISDSYKKSTVNEGGQSYPCWLIRNGKFLRQVLNGFSVKWEDGYPLIRLPHEWSPWLVKLTDISPVKHLTGPSLDPVSGKWVRGKKGIDDLYYAAMFAEAALYLWLTNPSTASSQIILPGSLGIADSGMKRSPQNRPSLPGRGYRPMNIRGRGVGPGRRF
ncbi:MAG: hypothetical protein F6K65_37485 [Moorea sp. SIO3C2]|nr:hypothetical protein [Moorena sp. SIO3C2]